MTNRREDRIGAAEHKFIRRVAGPIVDPDTEKHVCGEATGRHVG